MKEINKGALKKRFENYTGKAGSDAAANSYAWAFIVYLAVNFLLNFAEFRFLLFKAALETSSLTIEEGIFLLYNAAIAAAAVYSFKKRAAINGAILKKVNIYVVLAILIALAVHRVRYSCDGLYRYTYLAMSLASLFNTTLGLLSAALLTAVLRKPDGRAPAPCSSAEPAGGRAELYAIAGGFAFLLAALIYLEAAHPYYFTQDDNLHQCLPSMIQEMRAFFDDGVFPTWNPYQFLGFSTAEGANSTTYPFTYLTYAFARYVLQNEVAFFEVYAAFHIIAGYFAAYFLLKKAGLNRPLSVLGSLSFVLSGFILIAGRSWYMWTTAALWYPLAFYGALWLCDETVNYRRWFVFSVAVWALFLLQGWSQSWAYVLFFYIILIALLWAGGKLTFKKVSLAGLAVFTALGFGFFLVLRQMQVVHGLNQKAPYGEGILKGFWALFFPYPVVSAPHPMGFGNIDVQLMTNFYYFGSIFAFLAAAGLALLALRYNRARLSAYGNVWLLLAIIAFDYNLGPDGILYQFNSKIPVFGKVNDHPFKMLPLLVLFSIIAGGLVYQRFTQKIKNSNLLIKLNILTLAAGLALLSMHVYNAHTAFYTYANLKPYPALPPAFEELDKYLPYTTRVLPFVPERSQNPHYAAAMPHQFATYYKRFVFHFYDSAFVRSHEYAYIREDINRFPIEAARAYGVKWLLLQDCNPDVNDIQFQCYKTWEQHKIILPVCGIVGLESYRCNSHALENKSISALIETALSKREYLFGTIYELPDPQPLVFDASNDKPLPFKVNGRGAKIDATSMPQGGKIVFNYIGWYYETRTFGDGKPLKWERDEWRRTLITVPPGTKEVVVDYSPGFDKGMKIGAIFVLLSVLGYYLIVNRRMFG